MEIYTNDFVDIAENHAKEIEHKLSNDYAITDGCIDLMIALKRILYMSDYVKHLSK